MKPKRMVREIGFLMAISLGMLAAQNNTAPTFNKDVLPILQKNCQSCHRPGQVAPMSLAHYDNSANNKWNPNPNKTVYYGEMTWEEMMFPFFGVVVDKDADTSRITGGGFGGGGGARR